MAKQAATLKPQIFRITAPKAQRVLLVGEFTDWQNKAVPMTKNGGSEWTVTVNLAPGNYDYRFIVDGEWCDDPACAIRVPNPFGGCNMVRQVA